MRKMKVRIGTKLGVSAFIGLVLVAGMVGNQARVNRLTQDLMKKAALSRQLQQAALESKSILSELISVDRDLRLATTSAGIAHILSHLSSRAVVANMAYDSALAKAILDVDRQSLATARNAFNEYVVAAESIASIQSE